MEIKLAKRPHAVFVPLPAQGHINPFLKLAKLLHSRGFFITFVYTEFDYARILNTSGQDALKGSEDFRFETIDDGLPPSDLGGNRDISSLLKAVRQNCLVPFHNLLTKLNDAASSGKTPPVSLVIWDTLTSFARKAAAELGIPDVMFCTSSACGLMGFLQFPYLAKNGFTPFKDESYLTNGFLDTEVDWISGITGLCLRDLPVFFRTTDPNDVFFNFIKDEIEDSYKASKIILTTMELLEDEVLSALRTLMAAPIYTIGPIHMLYKQLHASSAMPMPTNLWKADTRCIDWLDQRDPKSVVYVNFGSVASLTKEKLLELAWGLAKSGQFFLWVLRADLVVGDKAALPEDFIAETEGRSFITSWCDQEKVLSHPSLGAFLTHCGWNGTMETISAGVPMICWPLFGEQTTNCYYVTKKWGNGVELSGNARREEVEELVREVMESVKGMEMRKKASALKELTGKATQEGGTSCSSMNLFVDSLKQ